MPSSSRRASTSATSSRPVSAREPNVGVLKRAPSSSAKAITATPGSRSAAANPAATPSGPSKRPPRRTLSRCDPVAHHGPSPPGSAHSDPAGSRSTRMPGGRGLLAEPRLGGGELRRPREPVDARGTVAERGQPVAQLRRLDHDRTRHAWSGRTHASSPATRTAATGLCPKR